MTTAQNTTINAMLALGFKIFDNYCHDCLMCRTDGKQTTRIAVKTDGSVTNSPF